MRRRPSVSGSRSTTGSRPASSHPFVPVSEIAPSSRPATARRCIAAASILFAAGGDAFVGVEPLAAQWEEHPVAGRATVEEQPGRGLPLEAELVDEGGRTVRLGHFFRQGRPVLLVPGYYECPMLCPLVLDGLRNGLASISGWKAGAEYVVVVVSVDPVEGPAEARARRSALGAPQGWHFTTGERESVAAVADALGFRYGRDDRTGELAHVALSVAATPDGRVGRYVYGVDPGPEKLREALYAARSGRAASSLEQVLVRCFRFVPVLQRYAGALAWLLKLGGVAALGGLAGVFLLAGRRALREGVS